jgi:hypothetical protein
MRGEYAVELGLTNPLLQVTCGEVPNEAPGEGNDA